MKRLLLFLLTFGLFSSLPAAAQEFTLGQLIGIRNMVDLPAINTFLGDRGWAFSESAPAENYDQVVWVRERAGQRRAVLNVLFCKKCSNSVCDKCDIHASGDGAQHAITIIYQPTSQGFLSLKREAEANKMQVKTLLNTGALELIYTGIRYQLTLSEFSSPESPMRYLVQLTAKPTADSSE